MCANQLRNRALNDLKRHIDLGRCDVLIFNLSLGQRRLFNRRPHDWLRAAIKLAALGELQQLGNNRRLGLKIHRQIGIIPIGIDAQPLQLLALRIDPILRISAAFGAELDSGNFVLVQLFLAILLLNLPFNGQAMAIPTGDIRGVLAKQSLCADNHVFQDMVQRMADMHVTIGIRRAIMQDELLPPTTAIAQVRIEILLLPARQNARLLLRKASLHREVGFGQEYAIAIVLFR